jgi:DNA replication protein DnaC
MRGRVERLRRDWRANADAFLEAGGTCVQCFDSGRFGAGTCDYCDKGRQLAAANRAREAGLYVAQAGLRPFAARGLDNWPLDTGDGPEIVARRRAVRDRAVAWLERGDRPGLLLCGRKGNGKSSLAAALLRAQIERECRPGLRLTESEFMALLKPGPDQDNGIRFQAQRVPFLALDDLGTEKETQFTEGERFGVINARYEHARWTVLTTNFPFEHEAFVKAIGERVHDRLREFCHIVNVPGSSLRDIDRPALVAGSR